MLFSNNCGGYCDNDSMVISKEDKVALLKEKEAILEAKLATVKHWIETTEKEKSESGKD